MSVANQVLSLWCLVMVRALITIVVKDTDENQTVVFLGSGKNNVECPSSSWIKELYLFITIPSMDDNPATIVLRDSLSIVVRTSA